MTTNKKTPKLPDKLSALILLALSDMMKVRRRKGYKIDLDVWHDDFHGTDGVCSVCFAGSVMAGTLMRDRTEHLAPSSFDRRTERKLIALNNIRLGDITRAIRYFYGRKRRVDHSTMPHVDEFVGYLNDRAERAHFYRQMRALAKWLAAQGL